MGVGAGGGGTGGLAVGVEADADDEGEVPAPERRRGHGPTRKKLTTTIPFFRRKCILPCRTVMVGGPLSGSLLAPARPFGLPEGSASRQAGKLKSEPSNENS